MRRQLASAAAIMVGRQVEELQTVLHQHLYAGFTPWKRQEPGVKPRVQGWIMAPSGRRVLVTILVDDGASHCFVRSSFAREWGLARSAEPGPSGVLLARCMPLIHLSWYTWLSETHCGRQSPCRL